MPPDQPRPVREKGKSLRGPLRVLAVEDAAEVVDHWERELRSGGYQPKVTRVTDGAAMLRALDQGPWDIVLSDWTTAHFSALKALTVLRETEHDVPVIILSSTAGEEAAVQALKAGAQDYLAKERLALLAPTVERAVREAHLRDEQAKLREQLILSERLTSVGALAAGVAHEINNPLSAVLANLDFVLGLAARGAKVSSEEIVEPLRDAREAAERMREIVRDVKLFSRSGEEVRGLVDVRRVIDSSARMAWSEVRHRARLAKLYEPVPQIEANEARLGQLFLNLIVNAAHAIPEGAADRNEIRITTGTDERGRIVVEVRDSGSGIPKEILGRIFEPFFTTKPPGVGTGLGLAICHRIVTGLGGEIGVSSEVGKGSTFRVVLPSALQSVARMKVQPVQAAVSRRARVLVIDDEPAIGRAVQRSLSAHHDVVALTSAREALERLLGDENFDVVVCDLMMPEMSGMELYDTVSRRAPTKAGRIVFLTGGAFTPAAREFLARVPNARIEKPFEMPTLLSIVSDILQSAKPA